MYRLNEDTIIKLYNDNVAFEKIEKKSFLPVKRLSWVCRVLFRLIL